MVSIYKTDEGRQTMARWYDVFVEQLGRDRVDFAQVQTRYGATNILMTGPEDAPPLWCFHGVMSSAPAALSQLPSLSRSFRIHFPDTIGQPGRSDERRLDWQGDDHGWWVLDILDGLGIDTIDAVGVSLGGYVLLRAASVAPTRIGRSVIWVPGGLIKPPWSGMLPLMMGGLMYAMFPSRPRLERLFSRTTTDMDPRYMDFLADSLRHVHPDRRFPNTLPDGALDAWEAPVMLIAHELDTVFPAPQLIERARVMIKHLAHVEFMEGWAHMPPFDEARHRPLVQKIEAFFKEAHAPTSPD